MSRRNRSSRPVVDLAAVSDPEAAEGEAVAPVPAPESPVADIPAVSSLVDTSIPSSVLEAASPMREEFDLSPAAFQGLASDEPLDESDYDDVQDGPLVITEAAVSLVSPAQRTARATAATAFEMMDMKVEARDMRNGQFDEALFLKAEEQLRRVGQDKMIGDLR
jgi:hypothetical protein